MVKSLAELCQEEIGLEVTSISSMGWWQAAEPRCLNVMSTTEMRLGPYCYFAVDEVDWLLAFLGRASTILSPPQQWGREGVDTLVLYCAVGFVQIS